MSAQFNTDDQLQEPMESDHNELKLDRRFSIPARLKSPPSICNSGRDRPASFNTQTSLRSQRASATDGQDNSSGRTLGDQCSKRHYDNHNHRQVNGNDKSSSPASSSASDSAFSQSQTTLESESDQSNCFSRSLKDLTSGLRNHIITIGDKNDIHANRERIYKSLEANGGDNSPTDGDDDQDDTSQFRITWRNLSYRVPEKKFARTISWLKRKKESIWPSEDEVQPEDSLEIQNMKTMAAKKPRKVIFSHLNGSVKSGQLTAILGPSGAGKTTFLKCLTNTISNGVSGDIEVTGGKATSHHLKLCIIPQKDYLFDNLTVMENLIFASRIKNTQGNFNHLENVERVASLLGLQSCLKLKTSRLSGGQYKRVSIAQELLSKPDILILDEPTSGLDSLTCFRTVSVLRDLVNKSRLGHIPPLAIIMTIHQPQIKIFNLFHHVYIMSSLGQCVYEGRPEFLIETVADCCKLLPPPDDLNPASFIIDLASEVYGKKPIDQLTRLQEDNFTLIHSNYEESATFATSENKSPFKGQLELHLKTSQKDKPLVEANLKTPSSKVIEFAQDTPNDCESDPAPLGSLQISDRLKRNNINRDDNFWYHTGLLIKRLWISMWRDPLLATTRISFHLIIPFVFYFIYSQKSGAANACPHVEREFDFQTMGSDANIQRLAVQHNELVLTFENVSLFFLLLYSFSMCVLAVTALSFPLNMQILLKETTNGWYSMSRFVMAKTIADLPMELTMPVISVAIAYVLTGQPSSYLSWRMLTVTAVMTLCSLISQTQGLLFGAYFMNNVQAAVFISQASSLPWIMLSGFTTRISELPSLLQWLSFGSIYRLGIESIVAVRYGFGMCPCDQEMINDTPTKMVGVPDQLRSVMRYYLDMYAESATGDSNNQNNSQTNPSEDIFERMASTLSRANTYGMDIVTCRDVRPFIMSAREVGEETLPTFVAILVFIFVTLKLLLFYVVRLRAS